jgi:hypothetical protein
MGPEMDCLNNPLGAVRTLFEKACKSPTESIEDAMRSDWGVKELVDTYLNQQGGFKLVRNLSSLGLPLSTFSSPQFEFKFPLSSASTASRFD